MRQLVCLCNIQLAKHSHTMCRYVCVYTFNRPTREFPQGDAEDNFFTAIVVACEKLLV